METVKNILITGACGGLGRAAVREFADCGYRVFAADTSPFEGGGERVFPVVMDVTSNASVESAARLIEKEAGSLDCVIHLAGVYTMDSFVEIPEEELSGMLDVNLMGVYRVDRAFLPLLRKAGGRIIIVASELAPLDPLPFNGIYSMTKTALSSYAHSLALELGLIGIKVITFYPGAFGDGMTKGAVRAMDRMREKTELYPDITERFRKIVLSQTGGAKDPALLAAKLRRAAEKKRPRFRYYVNNSMKLRLFSALPDRVQAAALALLLKRKA
ncbi:MAG: SDR family NAD(P)-dependent oxidoreductase [Clostridia bacterium]|nr:SDR family NAD(P)-dependent oxidoreductase [Clostridia bacterium]